MITKKEALQEYMAWFNKQQFSDMVATFDNVGDIEVARLDKSKWKFTILHLSFISQTQNKVIELGLTGFVKSKNNVPVIVIC
jgi:hypothetical protein